MTTEETKDVVDKKLDLEEEFKKLQEKVNEMSNNNKIKDELLAKAEKDKKDLEQSYKLLSDTHQLLKDNMPTVATETDEMYEYFKKIDADVEGLNPVLLKIIYNTRKG